MNSSSAGISSQDLKVCVLLCTLLVRMAACVSKEIQTRSFATVGLVSWVPPVSMWMLAKLIHAKTAAHALQSSTLSRSMNACVLGRTMATTVNTC